MIIASKPRVHALRLWLTIGLLFSSLAAADSAADAEQADATYDVSQAAPDDLDFSVVNDKTPISARESELYYALLDKAERTNGDELRRAAEAFRRSRWETEGVPKGQTEEQFPGFADLVLHADAYRGAPVTLSGHSQDILVSRAGTNSYGIESLYEAWLYTPDSQQIPTIVVFTELPEGLEIGRQLVDGITVTGYFLKLHAYRAQDGKLRWAPLLLAHRLDWNPREAVMSLPNWMIGVGATAVLIVAAWVWWTARNDRAFILQHRQAETGPVDLKDLAPEE